ncbi:MAG: hypothetical protein WBA55_04160 [Allopontixanthobacter sediminis]
MSVLVLKTLGLAVLISFPGAAAACMIEPLPHAKIFDAPPKELDKYTKAARFEVLEIGDREIRVRLIEPLFGLPASAEASFISDWDTCTLQDEVWGDDFGAVTLFRDEEGNSQLHLRSFNYRLKGPFFWKKRVPIGPMLSLPPGRKAHLSV